jgi:tRNA U34 5-methylaminomethyl-2-thiouridine-forming methyltransferase MnmC
MLEIVKTGDGSNTIFNDLVGENYHSKHGAVQESTHVFLNSGLRYFLTYIDNSPLPFQKGSASAIVNNTAKLSIQDGKGDLVGASVSILEVGFGTGLNFLLSTDFCTGQKLKLDYTGIEAYPLSSAMINRTGHQDYVSVALWESFQLSYIDALHQPVELNPYCTLRIANCELLNFQSEKQYDVIYFDAFAVARQPEMWTDAAIGHTIEYLNPGGAFVTYAITGNLKRTLKALGCNVEKVPGAPGKREMLRAIKPTKEN